MCCYDTACEDLPDIYDQYCVLEVLVRYLTFWPKWLNIWKILCWSEEMSMHIKDDLRTNYMFRYCWSFKYYSNLWYIHICILYTCTYNYFEISLHYCEQFCIPSKLLEYLLNISLFCLRHYHYIYIYIYIKNFA